MATVTITHTRADGTLLDGSRKGDGVFDIVRHHGFWSFRSLGQLGIRHSRDKAAQMWKINGAAQALRAAGHEVTVEIDEDTRRTFAEAEADRVERAEVRAEVFADRAAGTEAKSDAAWNRARHIGSVLQGEPIKIGHHSEGRHRRDLDRIHNLHGAAVELHKTATYYADRASASAAYEKHRNNPARTLRRMDKLEADLRRVKKWQAGESAGGFTRTLTPDTVAELKRREEELNEELGYWRALIARAEADGFKVWGQPDFKKGDFARIRGRWYEVLRSNRKTLTVPGGPDIQPVVSRETSLYPGMTRTAPYDEVAARMSGEEMRRKLEAARAAVTE
ncbi:DUF3560 domain-containing protein [Embleya sp. NPDC001921]